ncbi:MAG: MMPL family transporter, partial [Actinomycetota bacterium]|nr:MMPL family transporter [Actinomycetota bacterium]
MQRLTRRVLRHKRLVAIGWILLTLVGVVAAGPASQALDQRFSVPGREGWETNQEILRLYGNGGETLPLVPVVRLPEGKSATSPGVRAELRRVEAVAREAVPRSRVAGFGSTGDATFTSRDEGVAFAYVFPGRSNDPFGPNVEAQRALRDALRNETVAGAPVRLTGYDALYDSTGDADEGPGVLLEAVLGGTGALIVLAFVFGSWLALVPLAMAICSVLVSFLLLWGLTAVTEISPIVQFLVALIGLGVSIDYALLIVVRWREEREKGLEGDEAVAAAMGTAGRAVVFSGTTVAVGLLALIALPLPFLRSMGYGGILIPLVATLVAITLLPVILATIGPRLDWPRNHREAHAGRGWSSWARLVVRHRWVAATASMAALVALVVAASTIQFGNPLANSLAQLGPARAALDNLTESGIGTGPLSPFDALVRSGDPDAVAEALANLDGVRAAAAPADWRR